MRGSLIIQAVLLLAAGSATAAGLDPLTPSPGWYRIDSDVKFTGPNGGVTIEGKTSGATGATVTRTKAGGSDTGDRLSKGEPMMRCVRPRADALPPLPTGCKRQDTRRDGEQAIHTAVCPSGTTRMTVRRLDKDRWEYLSEHVIASSIAAPNLAYLRPVLEAEIKHGKTAAARLKAEQQLAQLPAMQAQMTGQHAQVLEKMVASEKVEQNPQARKALAATIAGMRGARPMSARTRDVWTRVAESCPVGQPAPPNPSPP